MIRGWMMIMRRVVDWSKSSLRSFSPDYDEDGEDGEEGEDGEKMKTMMMRRMIMMIVVRSNKSYDGDHSVGITRPSDEDDNDDIIKKMFAMRSHFSSVMERVRDPLFSFRSTLVIEPRLT